MFVGDSTTGAPIKITNNLSIKNGGMSEASHMSDPNNDSASENKPKTMAEEKEKPENEADRHGHTCIRRIIVKKSNRKCHRKGNNKWRILLGGGCLAHYRNICR